MTTMLFLLVKKRWMALSCLPVRGWCLAALTALLTVAQAQDAPRIPVHDPVMIRQDSLYYVFATGKGIRVWSSTDRVHWKAEKPVFDSTPGVDNAGQSGHPTQRFLGTGYLVSQWPLLSLLFLLCFWQKFIGHWSGNQHDPAVNGSGLSLGRSGHGHSIGTGSG